MYLLLSNLEKVSAQFLSQNKRNRFELYPVTEIFMLLLVHLINNITFFTSTFQSML